VSEQAILLVYSCARFRNRPLLSSQHDEGQDIRRLCNHGKMETTELKADPSPFYPSPSRLLLSSRRSDAGTKVRGLWALDLSFLTKSQQTHTHSLSLALYEHPLSDHRPETKTRRCGLLRRVHLPFFALSVCERDVSLLTISPCFLAETPTLNSNCSTLHNYHRHSSSHLFFSIFGRGRRSFKDGAVVEARCNQVHIRHLANIISILQVGLVRSQRASDHAALCIKKKGIKKKRVHRQGKSGKEQHQALNSNPLRQIDRLPLSNTFLYGMCFRQHGVPVPCITLNRTRQCEGQRQGFKGTL